MLITRTNRRDFVKYGIGAATLAAMRAQVRIPGPGGAIAAGGGGGGGWSLVTSTSAGSTGGSDITTSAINTTGANLIVAGIASGSNTPTVSDSSSNIWTPLNINGGGPNIQMFYCSAATVGSGHTFTTSTGNNAPSIYVLAFSGSAASPLDQQNGVGATSGITTVQPGSITPGQNNELIVTLLGIAAPGAVSAGSINQGFTILGSQTFSGGNHYGGAIAYLMQSTAAAVNPTWTATGSASLLASIASFK